MNRKNILALVAISVAAIVGAYASSLMSTGSFQLGDVETVGSFTVEADRILIYGGPPSMLMRILNATESGTPLAFANQCQVEIINMVLTKVEGDRILEIKANRVTGKWVAMYMESLSADNAKFSGLRILDIPAFEQSARNNVTFTGNVEIHGVYMFAKLQKLYGMEINIKESG